MSYIRLTKELDIKDIINGRISKKEAYNIFITDTIFSPVKELLSKKNTDYHFAVLLILLTFFEPHGKFIGNYGGSKKNFNLGLKSFFNVLEIKTNIPDKIYEDLRCGLFHSMNMRGILIDSIGYCKNEIFSQYNNTTLINIENLFNKLKKYFESFMENYDEDAFNEMFDKIILSELI